MAPKPDFTRVRRALLLEGEPDRVPLFEIAVDADVMRAFLNKRRGGFAGKLADYHGKVSETMESFVEFWVTAGYDFVPLYFGFYPWLTQKGIGRKAKAKFSLYTDEFQDRVWAEEGTGVIASLEDFQRFPWPKTEELDFSALEIVGRYLPPGMKAIACQGGIFMSVLRLMGFENFCISLIENPDLVARMFDKMEQIWYEAMDRLAEFDCIGAMAQNDDIAYNNGLLVAPKYLRQYLFPIYKRMNAVYHERGLATLYHSDGRVYEAMEDIISAGFNALHPVEPGAMDIEEVKKRWGERLCLCGNIDLDYTLSRGRPEEVEEEVKKRLRQVAPGGGFCLGSGNSVPRWVPLENYNAMRETVLKYGTYPISV